MSDPSVPRYWKELKSKSKGRVYYFNILSHESIWEKPIACYQQETWIEAYSDNHKKKYFFNTKTAESVWEKPQSPVNDRDIEVCSHTTSNDTKDPEMNRQGSYYQRGGRMEPRNNNWRASHPHPYKKSNEARPLEFEDAQRQQRLASSGNDRFRRSKSVGIEPLRFHQVGKSNKGVYFEPKPPDRNTKDKGSNVQTKGDVPPQIHVTSPATPRESEAQKRPRIMIGPESDSTSEESPSLLKRSRPTRSPIVICSGDPQNSVSNKIFIKRLKRDATQDTQFQNSQNYTNNHKDRIGFIPGDRVSYQSNQNGGNNSAYNHRGSSYHGNKGIFTRHFNHRDDRTSYNGCLPDSSDNNRSNLSADSLVDIQKDPDSDRMKRSSEGVDDSRSNSSRTPAQDRLRRIQASFVSSCPSGPVQDNSQHTSSYQNATPIVERNNFENSQFNSHKSPHNKSPYSNSWNHRNNSFQHTPYTNYRKFNDSRNCRNNNSGNEQHNHPRNTHFNNAQGSHFTNSQDSHPISFQTSISSSTSSKRGIFAHPGDLESFSPFGYLPPRSRSSSVSSGMSVDSPTSRPVKPTVPPFPSLDTLSDQEQDNMEWESIPTAVILQTVDEVRHTLTPSKAGFQIPSNSAPLESLESSHQARSILMLVLDTNVFLSSMEFVSRVRDKWTPEFGYPIMFVPWQVLQELDHIKDRSSGNRSLKLAVTKAIRFIEDNLRTKHKRVVFQDRDSMEQSSQVLAHESPDDRILAGCLQLISILRKIGSSRVVLVSEDVNLRNKAQVNKVTAHSVPQMEDVIFRNKQLLSTVDKPLSEEDQRVQSEMEHLFCSLKSKLFDVMSQILVDVMKKKMDPHPWERGIYLKPPWDWKKIWANYQQHWASFEDGVASYSMRYKLTAFRTLILKHERDSEVTIEILDNFHQETSQFMRNITHPALKHLDPELLAVQKFLDEESKRTSPALRDILKTGKPNVTEKRFQSERRLSQTGPSESALSPNRNYRSPSVTKASPATSHRHYASPSITGESPITSHRHYTSPPIPSESPVTSNRNYASPLISGKSPVTSNRNYASPLISGKSPVTSNRNYASPLIHGESPVRSNRNYASPPIHGESPVTSNRNYASPPIHGESPVRSNMNYASPPVPNASPILNESDSTTQKVFVKFDQFYTMLESFRKGMFKFLGMDPGVSGGLELTEADIQATFMSLMTRLTMVIRGLEKIFADSPDHYSPTNSSYLRSLWTALNKGDSQPLTLAELDLAFGNRQFYTNLSAGVNQFVELYAQYEQLMPLVEHLL